MYEYSNLLHHHTIRKELLSMSVWTFLVDKLLKKNIKKSSPSRSSLWTVGTMTFYITRLMCGLPLRQLWAVKVWTQGLSHRGIFFGPVGDVVTPSWIRLIPIHPTDAQLDWDLRSLGTRSVPWALSHVCSVIIEPFFDVAGRHCYQRILFQYEGVTSLQRCVGGYNNITT